MAFDADPRLKFLLEPSFVVMRSEVPCVGELPGTQVVWTTPVVSVTGFEVWRITTRLLCLLKARERRLRFVSKFGGRGVVDTA